jgi:serine/threonine protein kinase
VTSRDSQSKISKDVLKSVKIHEFTYHSIALGANVPQYTDEVFLSCDQKQFFTEKVIGCAIGTEHLFADRNNSQTPTLCKEIISNPTSNFVAHSRKIAEHFLTSRADNEPSAILIITRVTMHIDTVTKSFIAILKVDYTKALQQVSGKKNTKILKIQGIIDSLLENEAVIQNRVLIDVENAFKWDVLALERATAGQNKAPPLAKANYFKEFSSVLPRENDSVYSSDLPGTVFDGLKNEQQMKSHFKTSGYTLLEKIGQGGFGVVYKAIHIKTKKLVAIKILLAKQTPDLEAKNRQRLRFEREVSLCSQLKHPNIVRLLDKGELGEHLFAVFSFVDGVTLKQKLFSCGALSPIDAFNIMMQILDALIHSHSHGIVHRDIKPANIMLSIQGSKTHAVILDFGISTLTEQSCSDEFTRLTLHQEFLGSPSYATPEQLRGEPCTTKTDLYLWGLTFVECLTGRPFVSGASIASIFQQQLDPTPHALPTPLAMHPVASLLKGILHKKLHQRLGNTLDIYRSMSKLDFTTLVGNLADDPLKKVNLLSEDSQCFDDTLITAHSFTNAALTEQKQITVMCIRLDNKSVATPLMGDNAEIELFEQIYQQRKEQCIGIAQRYGATHISALGDTLLFYFGYPNVAGDDCRICAKSALEIIQWNCKQNSGQDQQPYNITLHISIHSGMVFIRQDGISEGKSINLAMALSRQAKANQILCSDTTRQILTCHHHEEVYVVDNLLIDNLSGQTYSLLRERRSETSRITRTKGAFSNFCTRQAEFNLLKDALLADSAPRCVHIHGEAGMGKSWLVASLYLYCNGNATQAKPEQTPIMVRCRAEEKYRFLQPIIALLNDRFQLHKLSPTLSIQRLSELLSLNDSLAKNTLSLLCAWLGYTRYEDTQPEPLLYQETAKKHVFAALRFLFCLPAMSQKKHAFIYMLEDIHWSDPISLDFISDLLSSSEFAQCGHFFLSTSTAPLPSDMWTDGIKKIALKKLNNQQAHGFLSHLFNHQVVSEEVEHVICELAEGNLLYMHELAESLKRNQQIHFIKGAIRFSSANHKIDIPCSLRDQLQQKLDRLTNSKFIAQIASGMGNEFDLNMLLHRTGQSKTRLKLILNELLQTDIICCRKSAGHERFHFKHKLVRETLYTSMSQGLR